MIKSYQERFIKAINDDLNTPKVLALVWDLLKSDEKLEDKLATVLDFDKVLGLGLDKIEDIPKEITKLAEERLQARVSKDWQKSDELRNEIEAKGFVVEDTKDNFVIKEKK